MADASREWISILAQLIRACEDCEAAYFNAAEKESSEELKELYRQYAAEATSFVSELKAGVKQCGGSPKAVEDETEDEVGDDLLDLNLEKQETKTLKLYNHALDLDWPGDFRDVLERHFTILEEAEDHIADVKSMRIQRPGSINSFSRDSFDADGEDEEGNSN